MLLIILILVIVFAGSGNFYAGRRGWYGDPGNGSNLVWLVVVVLILLALFGHLGPRWF